MTGRAIPLRRPRREDTPRTTPSAPAPPAEDDNRETDDQDTIAIALRDAARAILGGSAATARDRLRVAIAKGDLSLFGRVAEHLAAQAPFDSSFVANALTALQVEAARDARASDSRLRARNRELLQTARRDSLTRISNRGTLDDSLEAEVRRATRYGQPFSVLFIDIDRFKPINDEHGHAAGDRVLRGVAERIGHALRPGDVFGRYGGEEFIVGLVNADARAALRTAERLRQDIERAHFDREASEVRVTVSIGVATMTLERPVERAELVDRADRAMLQAKETGRNAVCAWSPRMP
jgi:diguanylate cyclase (GGDEF)-like protein